MTVAPASRVVAGDTTGFAHTSDLSEAGLLAAAEAAAAAARQGGGGTRTVALDRRPARTVSPVEVDPLGVGKATKVALLQRVDDAARSMGAAITQVSAGYGDSRKHVLVANTDGVLVEDTQVRTLFRVSVVANGDTGMQTGYDSVGHTMGFELFEPRGRGRGGANRGPAALTKLNARPAPSGTLPVVIKQGSGGVLFHEACGHGLEARSRRQGSECFYRGKVGELVASPLVTLVDDGTMAGELGRVRLRRRRPSQRVQRAHPGRCPHRLHVGPPPGPQGGPWPDGQRPPGRATCTCRWSA